MDNQLPVDVGQNAAKPVVVVSGVNLTEMGGLSILTDCLEQLAQRANEYTIIALVHRLGLVNIPNIQYLEFPKSKRSVVDRIYHEYWLFRKLSRRLNVFLWFSLHNTTPSVRAQRRAVYCHNAANLYALPWREAFLQPRFALVHTFLDLMYRANIRQNDAVVVQTEWVRQGFRKRFGLQNVVIAQPRSASAPTTSPLRQQSTPFLFFYPSHPTVYKNFEVLRDAVRLLAQESQTEFEVWLTFSGSENRYARYINKGCAELAQIRFLGRLPREEVFRRYSVTDCLVFGSKQETWGLPISEFRPYGRPMIVADAPYAREAVGDHPSVAFFPVDSPEALARLMKDAMEGAKLFGASTAPIVEPPFARSWPELFDILLGTGGKSSVQRIGTALNEPLVLDATMIG